MRFANAPSRARRIVRSGDTIVSTVRTYLKAVWFAEDVEDALICSTGFVVLTPGPGTVPKFVSYSVESNDFVDRLTAGSVGIAYPAVAESRFGSFHVCVPPLSEQIAIVRYLDHVDRRIRRYIQVKEQIITLLKEERQAVVSRAVTRGLDPGVSLKPSGVEWLGNVPRHWEVQRLKWSTTIIAGQSPPSANVIEYSGDSPFLQGNAEFGTISPLPRFTCRVPSKIAQVGDILLSVRAPVGAINIAEQEYGIGRGLCAIRPNRNLLRVFAYYTLGVAKVGLDRASTGSTYDAISVGDVEGLPFPLPPISEQIAIACYLDETTAGIDSDIAYARQQIGLLQEYRTRLVADVVTGKLDVRGATAKLPVEE